VGAYYRDRVWTAASLSILGTDPGVAEGEGSPLGERRGLRGLGWGWSLSSQESMTLGGCKKR
jgi:hypothetical protein